MINILAASRLMTSPRAYSTFLLYLLSELFEQLPKWGTRRSPASSSSSTRRTCSSRTPRSRSSKRSSRWCGSSARKGWGCTSSPRIRWTFRSGSSAAGEPGAARLAGVFPNEQKAVKAAAETFRANPKLDVVKAITELGVGEALVSVLDAKGTPSVVERAFILPPGAGLPPSPGREGAGRPRFGAPRALREGGGSGVRLRETEGEGGAAAGGGRRGRGGPGEPSKGGVPPRSGPKPG